jgi:hypothetical protein
MNNTARLEKVKIGLQQALSEHLLDVSVNFDYGVAPHIVAQVRGYIWGESVEPRTIKHPRDWWQAFKERWSPRWALRRWPVVYTVHDISAKVLYPNLRVQLPREKYSLVIDTWAHDEPWKHDGRDIVR